MLFKQLIRNFFASSRLEIFCCPLKSQVKNVVCL